MYQFKFSLLAYIKQSSELTSFMLRLWVWIAKIDLLLAAPAVSPTLFSLFQIQLLLCFFSMQQGNSPSYKLPVFVSPQAGDKGMRLFQKNTATLPWKRLLLVLDSPSVQQPEFSVASSYPIINLGCAHPSRFPLLFPHTAFSSMS